jgi:hypothetical protein
MNSARRTRLIKYNPVGYDNHYLLPLEWVGSVMSCGRIIRSGDDCKMRMRAESMIHSSHRLISGVHIVETPLLGSPFIRGCNLNFGFSLSLFSASRSKSVPIDLIHALTPCQYYAFTSGSRSYVTAPMHLLLSRQTHSYSLSHQAISIRRYRSY